MSRADANALELLGRAAELSDEATRYHDKVRLAHTEARAALRRLSELAERASRSHSIGNDQATKARLSDLIDAAEKALELHAVAGSRYTKSKSYLQSIRVLIALAVLVPGRDVAAGTSLPSEGASPERASS
jgi:hypothetical protein